MVLKYSKDKEKMMIEMVRLVKNKGLITIGIAYYSDQIEILKKTKSSGFLKEDENFEEVNSVKDITTLLKKP